MRDLKKAINDLLMKTDFFIGLDGIVLSNDMDVDENDVNKALEIIRKRPLGKGNHYNNELNMAKYFEEVEKMTSSKYVSDLLLSYANFLVVDGLTKYILYRVRQNGDLDKSVSLFYREKIRALNDHVQMYGPMNVLEDVVDGYLEICRAILIIIGKQIYGCAC